MKTKQKIYYEILGEGYPLIMLHGNGEDHTTLLPLARKLSTHYSVYLIDTKGHGKSEGNIPNSYDDMAINLLDFIHELSITKAHVLGYSDGAITALKALLIKPLLFDHLILCGININPNGLTDSVKNDIYLQYSKQKDPLLKLMLEGPIFNTRDLELLTHKMLFIFAEHDDISISHQLYIKHIFSGATHMNLPHETHGSYIMYNDQLYDTIIHFLNNTKST